MAITTATCPHKCAGGGKCNLNGYVAHHQHICRDAACKCHQPGAYGLECTRGAHDYVYVPRGVTLVEVTETVER